MSVEESSSVWVVEEMVLELLLVIVDSAIVDVLDPDGGRTLDSMVKEE